MSDFKGRHFRGEIVFWAVRWYCRYPISYRDLEAMMTERGVAVDHSTIYRWVQRFAPEMEKRLRRQWRRPQSRSWRVDETYIKVRGKWAYLYRAVDKLGNTIDFYLSATRNTKAAKRFLGKALRGLKEWEQPEVLTPSTGRAISLDGGNGIRITISGVRIRRPLRFGRLPEVGGLFRGPVPVSGGGALEPLAPWLHGLPPVAASGPFALDAP